MATRLRFKKRLSLASAFPGIAKQWHPTKNGSLRPNEITPASPRRIWWQCLIHKQDVWQASIASRSSNWILARKRNSTATGCPYCRGLAVNSRNSLASLRPDLAKQWHPVLNGDLKPASVTAGSAQYAWWICNRDPLHIWRAAVASRASGCGCPKCSPSSSQLELRVYSELKHLFPDAILRAKVVGIECDIYLPALKLAIEIDGHRWHVGKDAKDRQKNNRLKAAGVTLIRAREHGLRKISRRDVFFNKKEQFTPILGRLVTSLCRHISSPTTKALLRQCVTSGIKNERLYRQLLDRLPRPLAVNSLAAKYPSVAREWHSKKNFPLTATDVSPGSTRKVWWQCPKSKAHIYLKTVGPRTHGIGCPYCSGKLVEAGKDLKSLHPKLAREWDCTRNGELRADAVLPGSNRIVAWQCPKRVDHKWVATVWSRVSGSGCPYCGGKRPGGGNTLADRFPKLAEEWNSRKNRPLTPLDVTPGSAKSVFWNCKKHHDSWEAIIYNRTKKVRPSGCPACGRVKARLGVIKSQPQRLRKLRQTIKRRHGLLHKNERTPTNG